MKCPILSQVSILLYLYIYIYIYIFLSYIIPHRSRSREISTFSRSCTRTTHVGGLFYLCRVPRPPPSGIFLFSPLRDLDLLLTHTESQRHTRDIIVPVQLKRSRLVYYITTGATCYFSYVYIYNIHIITSSFN